MSKLSIVIIVIPEYDYVHNHDFFAHIDFFRDSKDIGSRES